MIKIILIFSLLNLNAVFPKLCGFRFLEEEFYQNKVAQAPEKFDGIPFDIVRNSPYTKLPDSLGGKHCSGLCVLTIDINRKGIVKGFYIQKLSLKKNNRAFIEWWTGNSLTFDKYPHYVKKYYSFLKGYASRLKITRNKYIAVEENNRESFLVRFN